MIITYTIPVKKDGISLKFAISDLDEIDNRIIELLLEDSRVPLAHISKEVGLSSTAIRERINKLIQNGVIKGSSTILDYKAWIWVNTFH
jgi:DNA-binding Lrp family transcriptional regulator